MSCSFVFSGQHSASSSAPIPLFNGNAAGLVFRPAHTPLACAKGGDSGGHCPSAGGGGWCPPVGSSTFPGGPTARLENFESADATWRDRALATVRHFDYPGDGCTGPWRPSDVGAFLERATSWQVHFNRLGYNEFVIHPNAWEASLPAMIGAFFVSKAAGGGYLERARAAHAAFGARYPGNAVPLVWMDRTNWAQPFSPIDES